MLPEIEKEVFALIPTSHLLLCISNAWLIRLCYNARDSSRYRDVNVSAVLDSLRCGGDAESSQNEGGKLST